MRRIVMVSLVGIVVLASGACSRKKPTTAAPPPSTTAPASTSMEQPADAGTGLAQDPLAGDLDSVNEYVHRTGLLRDVFYDYDSSELSLESQQTLAANARFLNEHSAFTVSIEGHCDERGTAEYNLALGERRANAARDYLMKMGVDGTRLSVISFGEERSACAEGAESCWSQNRRSHLVITARRVRG